MRIRFMGGSGIAVVDQQNAEVATLYGPSADGQTMESRGDIPVIRLLTFHSFDVIPYDWAWEWDGSREQAREFIQRKHQLRKEGLIGNVYTTDLSGEGEK